MKKTILILSIFIISVFSIKPGSRIAINNYTMYLLRDYLIPIVDKHYDLLALPNYTKKVGIFEFNFKNSFIHVDPIDYKNVVIKYENLSTKTTIDIINMSSNATINIAYKAGKLVQDIICKASIKEMSLNTIITNEIDSKGNPIVKVSSKLVMEISKTELMFYGSITAKILEVLEPLIKAFLVESVDIIINRELHHWIGDPINEILSSFKVDQPIHNTLYVNYELSTSPYYVDLYSSIPLTGYAYNLSHKFPPPGTPEDFPIYVKENEFAIQYLFTSHLFNSILNISFAENIFGTKFGHFTDPYSMNLICNLTSPPKLFINEYPMSNFTFKCEINATIQNTTIQFNVSGTSSQNLYTYVNSTFLQIGISSYLFSDLKYEKPKDFDIAWFESNLETIAYWPFNDISTQYLVYGIPLPIVNHTYITNTDSEVINNVIAAFANIVFH